MALIRKSIFSILLLGLVISLFLPFFTEAPISWVAGFCYIIYDTSLLLFVAFKVTQHVKASKLKKFISETELKSASVCILIAAKNEKFILEKCLNSIHQQTKKPEQIIIIDDGSTDGSFDLLKNKLQLNKTGKLWQSDLYPNVFVLTKQNSGKARSLNMALDLVTTDVVMTLDADTFMDKEAVSEIVKTFNADARLKVVGGILLPTCPPSLSGSVFKTFQKFEYIRSFLSRQAWTSTDCLLLVSGAFAAYKTDLMKNVGGFDPDSFVEDYELIHRIYKYSFDNQLPLHVGISPKAIAVTDCPDNLRNFLKQRQRWFGGFLQTIYKYRDMVGSRNYGPVGKIMLPVKSIDTLQPLYGLVSLYALVIIFISDKKLHPVIVAALIFKISLDYLYHFYGLYLYNQWQEQKVPKAFWFQSVLVTLCEPLFFQPLRHIGAFLGWYVFITNRNEWTAQRQSSESLESGQPRMQKVEVIREQKVS